MAADVLAQCLATYQLLNQDKLWIDANHGRHQVDDMSVRYKANVAAFLERRAASLANLYGYGEILAYSANPAGGEMAQDAAEEELFQADKRRMENSADWLRETTLVKRLLADVVAGVGGDDD